MARANFGGQCFSVKWHGETTMVPFVRVPVRVLEFAEK